MLQQAPKRAAVLIEDDDLVVAPPRSNRAGPSSSSSRAGAAAPKMAETERDRLIRTGVLTPFDRLTGYERRMQPPARTAPPPPPPNPDAEIEGLFDAPGRSGKTLRQIIAEKTAKSEALVKSRPTSKLMHHTQLPRVETEARKISVQFWRQAASGKVAIKKPKRTTTLPRRHVKGFRKAAKRRRKSLRAERQGDEEASSQDDDSDRSASSGSDYDETSSSSSEVSYETMF